jgi:hypothetical protein
MSTAGGAAGGGGYSFQDAIAAWAAVAVLGERAVSPRWELQPVTCYSEIRCETPLVVDDIAIVTSDGGAVYVQSKRGVTRSDKPDSALAKAVDQFVRQFMDHRPKAGGPRPWDRPLDPGRDRLVLATDAPAPAWVERDGPELLHRFRSDTSFTSLDAAHVNESQREVAQTLLGHARRSWVDVTGCDPSPSELRELFSLVRIDHFDLRLDGTHGRDDLQAMDVLRQAVLADPTRAEDAYRLVQAYSKFLKDTRRGANRAELQAELVRLGVDLVAVRSLAPDVDRLRQRSRATLASTHPYSVIDAGRERVKIRRPVSDALVRAVESIGGRCLVVGEPGAGKSGVIHDAVEVMLSRGWDVVYLAADAVMAGSAGQLRDDLGLRSDLSELLAGWHGPAPGVLAIDSLDAVRGSAASRTFRDLVRIAAGGRWRVIGSIRKFDLRCGADWQALFRGEPPDPCHRDNQFSAVRHIDVGLLTPAELDQVAGQSEPLADLIRAAVGHPLAQLLRQPFNLSLAAALLADGTAPGTLSPLGTQVELLDRYWDSERGVGGEDTGRLARQEVATTASDRMVADRTLSCPRSSLTATFGPEPLDRLLSRAILAESPPDRTRFNHHVLFDYAVARTLLRPLSPDRFAVYLGESAERFLFVQPSVYLHFQHLWQADPSRRTFWDVVLRVAATEGLPLVARLAGPTVAASTATAGADLDPLTAVRAGGDPLERAADGVIRQLVGSLIASAPDAPFPRGPLWYQWASALAGRLSPEVLGPVRVFLGHALTHIPRMTEEQRRPLGLAARRLLEYAVSSPNEREWIAAVAVPVLCQTIDTAPDATGRLLEPYLTAGPATAARVQGLGRLCRQPEVQSLIRGAPALVRRLYGEVFAIREVPNEQVVIAASQIVGLTTALRTEVQMAQYGLAEVFAEYLGLAPAEALGALAVALDGCGTRRRPIFPTASHEYTFDYGGTPARFVPDQSHFWDAPTARTDRDVAKMLNALVGWVRSQLNTPDPAAALRAAFRRIVDSQRHAVVWRRLLALGMERPADLLPHLLPLVEAEVVLASLETSTEAGGLLSAGFHLLDYGAKARIEGQIMAVAASSFIPEGSPRGPTTRARLLGCLPADEVVTTPAHELLSELTSANQIPRNIPPFAIESQWAEISEEERWEGRSIAFEDVRAARYRALSAPLVTFRSAHSATIPDLIDVGSLFPEMVRLAEYLLQAPSSNLPPELVQEGIGLLADSCVQALQCNGLQGRPYIFDQIREWVVLASSAAEPSEDRPEFDQVPSWDHPAPRVSGAQGILSLCREIQTAPPEVLAAVERLSRDATRAVRLQVAEHLRLVHRADPGRMWRIAESMASGEMSPPVLTALVSGTLGRLHHHSPEYGDRVVNLVEQILDRIPLEPDPAPIGSPNVAGYGVLLGAYLYSGHPRARDRTYGLVRELPATAGYLVQLLGPLRNFLDERVPILGSESAGVVRDRAWALMSSICTAAAENWNTVRQAWSRGEGNPATQSSDELRTALHLCDFASATLLFASGARGEAPTLSNAQPCLTREQQQAFLARLEEPVASLAHAAAPRVTHHLVQLLGGYVSADPALVFGLIGRVVTASLRGGYQYEVLGATEIVQVIERYLADHRDVLKAPAAQSYLIQILDAFLDWPAAFRLVYRIGDIYR